MTRGRYTSIRSIRVGRGNLGIGDLPEPEPWMYEGLCGQVDPDLWHPEKSGSAREAKRICAACPVADLCLRYALDHGESWGVWGGKSPQEREALAPVESEEARYRVATVQYLSACGWSVKAIAAELGISYATALADRKRPPIALEAA